jgi:hypothetical protein
VVDRATIFDAQRPGHASCLPRRSLSVNTKD